MSNPTELPDLDKLEALAIAAESVTFHIEGFEQTVGNGDFYGGLIMHQNGHTIVAQCVLNPWADFIAGANPAAVLALIALARRAKPEGEAPQADDVAKVVAVWLRYGQAVVEFTGNPPIVGDSFYRVPAATLSPLCGAQHAEIFATAATPEFDKACGAFYCENTRLPNPVEIYEIGKLAAQQAAAPGAVLAILRDVHDTLSSESDSDLDHFEDDEEERECAPVQYAARKVMEVMDMLKAAPSAPGTPEAPKPLFPISDDEMAALRRFWECATDGEGYDVEKSMMQRLAEMGLVQRKSGAYYMATDFGLYVLGEYMIQRAAQLDGGQEGSDHA